MAKTIDKGIRAPLDLTGERWAKKPNRYDFPGIDVPRFAKVKKMNSCAAIGKQPLKTSNMTNT